MIKTALLNVTQIEPRLKHPTIFEHFDALESGESFTILNDHDPRPLYYQLLAERGATFSWEYLESGPEFWRVCIRKPESEKQPTVGEIAASDQRKMEVFKQLGIDFCCGGKKSLKQAAEQAGMTEGMLQEALANAQQTPGPKNALDYQNWDISFLADYIRNVHHQYIRKYAPIIEPLAEKVALRHGAQHPQLPELASRVKTMLGDLQEHIQREENDLFNACRVLDTLDRKQTLALLAMLRDEHEHTAKDIQAIKSLTGNYTLPENACNSFSYLYELLAEFESDLLLHIHLENNILFPKLTEQAALHLENI